MVDVYGIGKTWGVLGFNKVVAPSDVNVGWNLTFTRPGKRLQKTIEKFTMFNGKIHYFYGVFSTAMLVYQRV
jgi:hypothetical protein